MALADDIAALESAIWRGVQSVAYDGHRVEYRSLADMRSILLGMKREAGTAGDAGGVSYPAFDRGTD